MAEADSITPDELNIPVKSTKVGLELDSIEIPPGGIKLEEVERGYILKALKVCDWVQKDAAGLLGLSKRVLNYRIKKFGITYSGWKRHK